MTTRFFIAVVLAVLTLGTSASAQYPFGKNKVIYESRSWKVLKTDHVDIYHYPSDANLILYVAPLVEETYLEFEQTFDVEFKGRVPFVFYNSHYDFQETNILPFLISEYTGGFTDLMKGRIAVPFTGQFATFRHVVRHEMVHAFMLEKLRQVMKGKGKFTYSYPPLWFVEGMAEYFAGDGQNTQGNMFVRDALFHDRLIDLENIWRIEGSFMMYKEGEAVVEYIGTNFGEEAVIQILENWWTADDFTFVLDNTIGMNLEQLNDAFMKNVKRRYYPSILTSKFVSDLGDQLTPKHTFHNQGVARLDDSGDVELHALCAQDGVINICKMGTREGRRYEDVIVKGSRSPDIESIPAFRSKLEAKGDTLLFVAKSRNRDRVYVWDTDQNKALSHFSFEDLSLLASPTLSPDRRRVVFSAMDRSGQLDLYLYDLVSQERTRLSDDGFSEEDPDYHPHREVILFTSDRGSYGRRDRTHIYMMDLGSGKITGMEGGRHADSDAEWAPDGRSFLFVSDREGVFNIYHHKGDVVVRQTNVIGGVNTPSFLPGGQRFTATAYTGGEFHLFEFPIRNGNGRMFAAQRPDSITTSWQRPVSYNEDDFVTQEYTSKMGVDFIGAGIAIDPEAGDIGNGGQVVLSDILGNHQIFMFAGTTTEDFNSNFWDSFNGGVTYVNRSHRINYALSAFALSSNNFATPEFGDRETRRGGAVTLSFPLNRFQRLDASVVGRRIDRHFFDLSLKKAYTGSAFLTWVEDRILWTIGGPLTGWRYYTTLGGTVDVGDNGLAHTSVQVDARKYFKLTRRSVFAVRAQTRNLFGADDDLVFYLGGPWTVRGYGFRDFYGRSTHLLNTELRFPLIDSFRLGLPFGVIEMPMFRGSLFVDTARAHRNVNSNRNTDWFGSLGAGVELNLGFAPVVRVNFTRMTDFRRILPNWGSELFIGFNY